MGATRIAQTMTSMLKDKKTVPPLIKCTISEDADPKWTTPPRQPGDPNPNPDPPSGPTNVAFPPISFPIPGITIATDPSEDDDDDTVSVLIKKVTETKIKEVIIDNTVYEPTTIEKPIFIVKNSFHYHNTPMNYLWKLENFGHLGPLKMSTTTIDRLILESRYDSYLHHGFKPLDELINHNKWELPLFAEVGSNSIFDDVVTTTRIEYTNTYMNVGTSSYRTITAETFGYKGHELHSHSGYPRQWSYEITERKLIPVARTVSESHRVCYYAAHLYLIDSVYASFNKFALNFCTTWLHQEFYPKTWVSRPGLETLKWPEDCRVKIWIS